MTNNLPKQYFYEAIDKNGKKITGTIVFESTLEVIKNLQDQDLIVVKVSEVNKIFFLAKINEKKLSRYDLLNLTQQLSILLESGQPLERAMIILSRQPGSVFLKKILERLIDRVKSGKPLSKSMIDEGNQFSAFYISLVQAGEEGGALAATLMQLSDYLERSYTLRSEVTNALIYPIFLVVGVLCSVAILLAYVIPEFIPIFKSLGIELPLVTKVIIFMSDFINERWIYFLGIALSLVMLLTFLFQNKKLSLSLWRGILTLKLIGPLIQQLETARFSRTLGTLISQGVSLVKALEISKNVTTNRLIIDAIEQASLKVKEGKTLSIALDATKSFADLSIQMIQVGEESGKLGVMLLKLADIYDKESKRTISKIMAALVPTLTLVMAAVVSFIMMAIMLPLMSLTSSI